MARTIDPKLWDLLKLWLPTTQFEKSFGCMYLDYHKEHPEKNKITVGVGHNLSDHEADPDVPVKALALPFKTTNRFERTPVICGDRKGINPVKGKDGKVWDAGIPIAEGNRTSGKEATAEEIKNDYLFLNIHKVLGKYTVDSGLLQKYTTVQLDQAGIDALLLQDVNDALDVVEPLFGKEKFYKFPLTCQAGLIDVQFNTGDTAGFHGGALVSIVKGKGAYAKLSESERWEKAAIESRRGISADRDAQVTVWFNQGRDEAKAAGR